MLLWPFFIINQPEFCINLTEDDRQAFGGRHPHHFQPESSSQLHAYSHLDPTAPSPQVNIPASFIGILKIRNTLVTLAHGIYVEPSFLMINILMWWVDVACEGLVTIMDIDLMEEG